MSCKNMMLHLLLIKLPPFHLKGFMMSSLSFMKCYVVIVIPTHQTGCRNTATLFFVCHTFKGDGDPLSLCSSTFAAPF